MKDRLLKTWTVVWESHDGTTTVTVSDRGHVSFRQRVHETSVDYVVSNHAAEIALAILAHLSKNEDRD